MDPPELTWLAQHSKDVLALVLVSAVALIMLPALIGCWTGGTAEAGYRSYFRKTGLFGAICVVASVLLTTTLICLCVASMDRRMGYKAVAPNNEVTYIEVESGAVCLRTEMLYSCGPNNSWFSEWGSAQAALNSDYLILAHKDKRGWDDRYVLPLPYLVIVSSLPAWVYTTRRYWRYDPEARYCNGCGYDLRGGSPGAACPECGAQ